MKVQTLKSIVYFYCVEILNCKVSKVLPFQIDGGKMAVTIKTVNGDEGVFFLKDGNLMKRTYFKRGGHSDRVKASMKDLYPQWKENFCKKWMCLANQLRGTGMTGREAMKKAHRELTMKPWLTYIKFEKAKNGEGTGVTTGRIIDPTKNWIDYQSPRKSGRKLKPDQVLKVDHFKVMTKRFPLISFYTYLIKDRAA